MTDQPDQSDAQRAWDYVRLYRLQVYPRASDFMVWSVHTDAPRHSVGEPHEDPMQAVLSAGEDMQKRATSNQ